jgi:hypothetical protein
MAWTFFPSARVRDASHDRQHRRVAYLHVDEFRVGQRRMPASPTAGMATPNCVIQPRRRAGLVPGMADGNQVTPEQLAERTGCNARLVREWLS